MSQNSINKSDTIQALPEYIKCVKRDRADMINKSWCGKNLEGFHFTSVDHAAENGAQEGWLVPCAACRENIIIALNNGAE